MSATNRGSERIPNDVYETPIYTVDSLFDVLDFSKVNTFLEPCSASGNIINKIPEHIASFYAELSKGVDYFKHHQSHKFDLIITNPPYTLAQEFINKALTESDSVWMLLRLNYLESKKRAKWWPNILPTHLLALSARPSFTGKGTDATGYAWFGWDRSNICTLEPGIHVLPYNK